MNFPLPHQNGKRKPLDRAVWILAGGLFVIALGFGIISPVLPLFAASFGIGPAAVSLIVSVFALTRLLGGPLAGPVVDKFGSRAVYRGGIVTVGVCTGLCAFAMSYGQLLFLRGLAGIGSALFTVATSLLLVELAPAEQRARAAGLMTTLGMLGLVGGPLVGSVLVQVDIRLPFLAYLGLMLAIALAGARLLGTGGSARPDPSGGRGKSSMAWALRHPTYRAALAGHFAVDGWAASGLQAGILPLYLAELRPGSAALGGVTLSAFAAGTVLLVTFSGRLADARGRKPVALAGLTVAAAATVAIGLAGSPTALIAFSFLAGAGAGLLNPPNSAAVTDLVSLTGTEEGASPSPRSPRRGRRRDQGGSMLAGYHMAAAAGSIAGPPALGVLATVSSYRTSFFTTAAVITIAALAWLFARETAPGAHRRPA